MTDVWDKDFLLLQVVRGRSAELKPNTVQLRRAHRVMHTHPIAKWVILSAAKV